MTTTPSGSLVRQDHGWRVALTAWLAARAVVITAVTLAWLLHESTPEGPFNGLLGWDASWYAEIARHGYDNLPRDELRFFPALPLLARALGLVPGVSVGLGLLAVANAAALGYARLLYALSRRDGLDHGTAARAVWSAALAPAAFVLVMGYAEALYGCAIVLIALLARRRQWWGVASVGVAAGGLRPTGVVVIVLIAVEAVAGWRSLGGREVVARLAAAASPLLGLAVYLSWVHHRYGDALLPYRAQTDPLLRGGGVVNPLTSLDASSAVHLVWVPVALALLAVCARRLPLSYTLFATATMVLALNSRGFLSFERVAGAAFPLAMAAALVIPPRRAASVAVVAAAGLGLYAFLAATGYYVP